MINDKKIEEAAFDFNDGELTNDKLIRAAFIYSAKWIQEEFLKNLWHPANEVPEIGRVIIMENYYPDGRIMFISHMRKSTFHNPINIGNTKKWFYIDDLFPKEED